MTPNDPIVIVELRPGQVPDRAQRRRYFLTRLEALWLFAVVCSLMVGGLYGVQELSGTGPDLRPQQCAEFYLWAYSPMLVVALWRGRAGEAFQAFGVMGLAGLLTALLLATVLVITPPQALLLILLFSGVAAIVARRKFTPIKSCPRVDDSSTRAK